MGLSRKSVGVFFILGSLAAVAAHADSSAAGRAPACPKLAGSYYCVSNELEMYSEIRQRKVGGVTEYTLDIANDERIVFLTDGQRRLEYEESKADKGAISVYQQARCRAGTLTGIVEIQMKSADGSSVERVLRESYSLKRDGYKDDIWITMRRGVEKGASKRTHRYLCERQR